MARIPHPHRPHLPVRLRRSRNHTVAPGETHPSQAELLDAEPEGPIADHLDHCDRCAAALAGASPLPSLVTDWPAAPEPPDGVLRPVRAPRAHATRFSRGVVSGRRRDWIAYLTVVVAVTGAGSAAGVRGLWRLVKRRRR